MYRATVLASTSVCLLCLLVVCFAVLPVHALDLFKTQPFLKQNLELQVLAAPVTTIKTKLTINGVPPGWQHGSVLAIGYVVVYDDSGEEIGVGIERKTLPLAGKTMMSTSIELPITHFWGQFKDPATAFTLAVLKNNDKCLILGLGKVGDFPPNFFGHDYEAKMKGTIGMCNQMIEF